MKTILLIGVCLFLFGCGGEPGDESTLEVAEDVATVDQEIKWDNPPSRGEPYPCSNGHGQICVCWTNANIMDCRAPIPEKPPAKSSK